METKFYLGEQGFKACDTDNECSFEGYIRGGKWAKGKVYDLLHMTGIKLDNLVLVHLCLPKFAFNFR